MTNTETDVEQVLNRIKTTRNQNVLYTFFTGLKITDLLPLQSRFLLVLEYFYDSGYKHFKSAEWGFDDVNSLNYKDRIATKPYGDLIRAIYNLCKESHTLQKVANVRIPYTDAYEWFTNCILELPMHDLEYTTFSSKEKIDYVEMWKERIRSLENLAYPPDYLDEDSQQFAPYKPQYNPFLDAHCTRFSHGLVLLVECAYSLAATMPNFEEKYWRPFIQAQKDIVHTLENSKYLKDARISKNEEGEFLYQSKERIKGRKYPKPVKFL